jgi:hypothetical protein
MNTEEKPRKIREEIKFDFNWGEGTDLLKIKKDIEELESLGVTYINETIRNCKETFQKRIKETIENYDMSKDVAEQISNEFGQMADTIYKLSELFQSKQDVS